MTEKKDKPEYETHPAYGVVGFSRISGDPGKLFGSAIPQHGHFVALRIKKAARKHDLGMDWIHGKCEDLIEVYLSAAQFSELLTTMNIGDGVPCTITRFNGDFIEKMPRDEKTETEKVRGNFKNKLLDFGKNLRDKTEEARELLSKGMKVSDRKRVTDLLDLIHREIEANLPFALTSFQEAVEKTTMHAKAELDAMVSHVVQTRGLEALGIDTTAALGPRQEIDPELNDEISETKDA